MSIIRRRLALALIIAGAPLSLAAQAPAVARGPATAPATDTAFAAAVARLSEPGGYFDTDNLISNEASYQHVLGALDALRLRGGAYIGVGPDQNFTYIAALRPELAIIVDIRRDNLLEHLLFRALFRLAGNRPEYLGLLLGRPVPAELGARAPIERIVAHLDTATVRPAMLDAAVAAVRRTLPGFGVPLSAADLATIERFHRTFAAAGLALRFETFGRGPGTEYPTLRQLILERDRDGRMRSYLARDEDFQFVRSLQERGRIIPVVGDLAGTGALPRLARFLRERGTPLTAFYVSNVEFYLAREDRLGAFIDNLERLPRSPRATLIRSAFRLQLPESVPGYASTQLRQPVGPLLTAWRAGRIRSYRELITAGPPAR